MIPPVSVGSHRAASVHCLCGARDAGIKTQLVFPARNHQMFSNITPWAQKLFVSIYPLYATSGQRDASTAIFANHLSRVSQNQLVLVLFPTSKTTFGLHKNGNLSLRFADTLLLAANMELILNFDSYYSLPFSNLHHPEPLKTPEPLVSPCFHGNSSSATLSRYDIQSTSAVNSVYS